MGCFTQGFLTRFKPCGGKKRSCEICKSVNITSHFKWRYTDKTFKILKGPFDCNSNHVIYLSECKQCQYRFPYIGSTKTKCRYRINNYKGTHGKFRKKYVEKYLAIVIKKSELKQKLFHKHYCSEGHQGIEHLSVLLVDQVVGLDSLKKKELYWTNSLNIWVRNGLNVREVYEAYNWVKKEKTLLEKAKVFIHIPIRTFSQSDIAVIKPIFSHLRFCWCYYYHYYYHYYYYYYYYCYYCYYHYCYYYYFYYSFVIIVAFISFYFFFGTRTYSARRESFWLVFNSGMLRVEGVS